MSLFKLISLSCDATNFSLVCDGVVPCRYVYGFSDNFFHHKILIKAESLDFKILCEQKSPPQLIMVCTLTKIGIIKI